MLRRFVRRGARTNISKLLGKTRPEDVALQFGGLTPAEQLTVIKVLVEDYPDSAGDVLSELESPQQQMILEETSPKQIATILDSMSVDDAVALVESLPSELQQKVLEVVDLRDLDEVQTHLTYGDDTAGRLMVPEFVALSEDRTVGDAIATIQQSTELDNIFYLYVVDRDDHLVGVTSLRQLLLSPPEKTLEGVMTRSVIKVHTGTDQEEVAQLASRYNLLAIPVTDDGNQLVGIVTLDDIIDVVEEEATEDIFKMVGTSDDELVYQDRPIRVAGFRLPWLLINLVGLLLAGMLIERFQVSHKEALFLLTFVPVIMGMGGNIGSQAATIAVRGLATGQVASSQAGARSFVWQQIKVGAVLALACALLVAAGAWVLKQQSAYAAVVGTSMFVAILLASLNGAVIPLIFERLGIDPAVAAGPLVTTSNDITGIVIYFGLASLFIELLVR